MQRLSLFDYACVCRLRDLVWEAPWHITDAEGLVITYAWPLHAVRHRLRQPDPLDWLVALLDLERTRDVSFISCLADGSTHDLGSHVVSLRGTMRLLRRFGEGRPWWQEPWTCEDCLCRLCGAPAAYPSSVCHNAPGCAIRRRRDEMMRQTRWSTPDPEDYL